MAKLARHEWDFEFSPWGIQRLLYDLLLNTGMTILRKLEEAWNETEPFEVEVEIPLKEHPHTHVLTVAVDPTTQQVTIERRIGNERFASCPDCRVAVC